MDRSAGDAASWEVVGRKAGELLLQAKSARGFADLARFAGKSAGYIDDQPQETSGMQAQNVNIVAVIMRELANVDDNYSYPDHDVVDADVVDDVE